MPTSTVRALAAFSLSLVLSAPSAAAAPSRQRVGVVLGSGGVGGLAHIGVLKWLYEHRIPVDAIAGTSMGALVGGIYATGKTPDELVNIAKNVDLRTMFASRSEFDQLDARRRRQRLLMPAALKVGLRHGIHLESAFAQSTELESFLDREFFAYGENTSFDSLPIRFRCVSTDLNSAEPVVFGAGSLPLAIRASTAIPGVFPPVPWQNHLLVDGALLDSLPVQVARGMDVGIVIAVSIPAQVESGVNLSLVGVLGRSISTVALHNEIPSRSQADIFIQPQSQQVDTTEPGVIERIIQSGWEAANLQSHALLPLQLSESDWQSYLQERSPRQKSPMAQPSFAEVQGGNPEVRAATLKAVSGSIGKSTDADRIERELDRIRASERWQASYSAANNGIAPGLLIHLSDSATGPPFLQIGAQLVAQSSDVTRTSFQQHLLWQDAGHYGSEFRFDSRLGFQTDLSTEYYYKVGLSKFFVAPRAFLDRDPVYIYQDQRRTAERLDRDSGGGFDLGFAPTNRSELRVGWSGRSIDWTAQTGSDGNGRLSGPVHDFSMRYSFYGQDHATVATSGFVFHGEAGYLLPGPLESGTPHAGLHAARFIPVDPRNTFVVAFSGATYFGNAVSDPLRFTLGGPYRLASAAIEEYRGDSFALLQPAFLHQIAQLPAPLGQRVFAAVAYEAGRVWNDGAPTVFRQDGVLGLLAETPLGPLGFGLSIGDVNHHKVFFTLGHSFGQ